MSDGQKIRLVKALYNYKAKNTDEVFLLISIDCICIFTIFIQQFICSSVASKCLFGFQLSITKGDIITITQAIEGGWWEGTLNERTGWFPSNYVTDVKGFL